MAHARLMMGLLAGVAPITAQAQPATTRQDQPAGRPAQTQAQPAAKSDSEEIVVTGTRPGTEGNIPPEIQLNQGDIRAYGVPTIADLLTELAPQTGSGRGSGMPVILLNGRRISSFAEIRNMPTEAIARLAIMPEEAALSYGYPANQRVVNIVLRQRFHALTAELEGSMPSAGGNSTQAAQIDILRISGERHVSLDANYRSNSGLLENERNVPANRSPRGAGAGAGRGGGAAIDERPYRTLIAPRQALTINGTYSDEIAPKVSGTLNAQLDISQAQALQGLPIVSLMLPAGNRFATGPDPIPLERMPAGQGPLGNNNHQITAHLGTTLNGDGLPWSKTWRWSITGNYDRVMTRSMTDRGFDPQPAQRLLNANDPGFNPFDPLSIDRLARRPADRAESTANTATIDSLLNGALFKLPAGDIATSLRLSGSTSNFESDTVRAGTARTARLSRDSVSGQANVDLPITSQRRAVLGAIGDLSINGNIAIEHLSDFGSRITTGYGIRWAPLKPLRFIASWSDEQGAPSFSQLGSPVIATPNVRVFDYRTGKTVTITMLTGGNPRLLADNRHVMKLGVELRPFEQTEFSLRADYVASRTRNAIATFPSASAAVEAAFPDRFVRDADGDLVSIDDRPINFARANDQQLRWGFNLSLPLKSSLAQHSPAARAQAARDGAAPLPSEGKARGQGTDDGQQAAQNQNQPPPPPLAGGLFGGMPGGGMRGPGFGGLRGGRAGRLQFSLYHTWYFKNQIQIREGTPVLDLLKGAATNNNGGQPAHQIDAQAGIAKYGLGARIGFKWQSSTRVFTGPANTDRLNFGALGTVDLRLFADLGQRPGLTRKHPWLRDMRVSLSVRNLFDSRQHVVDAAGAVPLNYAPDLLDPTGRSVRLSIRKMFF